MRTLFSLIAFAVSVATASSQPRVSTLKEWIGKTQADVEKAHDQKPLLADEYPASKAAGELRIKVTKEYPANVQASAAIKIREIWWADGDFRATFLFHSKNGKWVVLDAIRWHKDTVF